MALREHVEACRGVETPFGKIIPEREAYSYCLRTIAAFSANIFQVMRLLNDDWEDRTASITEIANMMNCAACAGGQCAGRTRLSGAPETNTRSFRIFGTPRLDARAGTGQNLFEAV